DEGADRRLLPDRSEGPERRDPDRVALAVGAPRHDRGQAGRAGARRRQPLSEKWEKWCLTPNSEKLVSGTLLPEIGVRHPFLGATWLRSCAQERRDAKAA